MKSMSTNVTLRLGTDLVKEAKILAARRGTSLSRFLGEHLEALVRDAKAYEAARRRALERLAGGYDLGWTPPTSRDELHER